ncbi:MAG: PAS domain-containing sensor histidine kinase [Rhizobiaceae bacterium]|nr:PAS domain-containing sensor histidine kinase [Rhizobiaceae bacterium]MCV0405515.1 PAS domain-containing sensor histidine kinase [Rhizobiaceae bacterium]
METGWQGNVLDVCDRFVRPSVTDREERARQRRLLSALFVFPFLAAGGLALTLPHLVSTGLALAAICGLFGAAWALALALAASGRRRLVEALALAGGAATVAAIAGLAGGAASPLMLLAAMPLVEARQVAGTRNALIWGGIASAASLFGALALAGLAPQAAAPAAWHWLVPALWSVTVWMRLDRRSDGAPSAASTEASPLEELLGIVRLDLSPGGDVAEARGPARRVLGLQPELLLGNGLFERVHVADRVAYLCALGAVREGADERTVPVRLRLPQVLIAGRPATTGQFRPFRLTFGRTPDGAIIAALRDDAEEASLREALDEALDKAASIDVAKSRFLAAVSHELRTPLNAIIGFSDILLHELFGAFRDERQREYVGLIQESGTHLLSVVNSILDVSKIESGAYAIHPEAFAFHEAAAMAHSMMSFQARSKSIRLVNEVAPEVGGVEADRRAVQQILINLLSNAIKFTPEGGEVRIGAGRLGSKLTFWVTDNGIGISEGDLGRIGQPFMQVQNDYTRQFEGTGLGLSLVKGLVELHGGEMSIESAPGAGTTVSIGLPAARDGEMSGGAETVAQHEQLEADHGAIRETA